MDQHYKKSSIDSADQIERICCRQKIPKIQKIENRGSQRSHKTIGVITRISDEKLVSLSCDIPVAFSAVKTSIISQAQITPLYKSESFLRQKYLTERLSAQIAAQIFSARSTVVQYLREYGIPLRDEDEQRNLRPGQYRFGERYAVGRLQPHKGELRIIAFMQELRTKGYSYHAIAEALQDKGLPTKNRRGRWHGTTVMKTLKNLGTDPKTDA